MVLISVCAIASIWILSTYTKAAVARALQEAESILGTECDNGIRDYITFGEGLFTGESDIDCGGPWCSNRCQVGQSCLSSNDCVMGAYCNGYLCVPNVETDSGFDTVEITTIACSSSILALSIVTFITVKLMERKERKERKTKTTARTGGYSNSKENKLKNNPQVKKSLGSDPESKDLEDGSQATAGSCFRRSSNKANNQAVHSQSRISRRMTSLLNRRTGILNGAQVQQIINTPNSLNNILADTEQRKRFFMYCHNKFASENLFFWEDICKFEKMFEDNSMTQKEREKYAVYIIETYIVDECKAEVNLAHVEKKPLIALYEESLKHVYDDVEVFQNNSFQDCKNEIFSLLSGNFFLKFLEQEGDEKLAKVALKPSESKVVDV